MLIIEKEKVSFYRVAKGMGIVQESLQRSLSDTGNPRWATIKKILDYSGYRISFRKEAADEHSNQSRFDRKRRIK